MYWEYSVIIFIFLKVSLQESLGLEFVIILIIFFCIVKTFMCFDRTAPKHYTISHNRVDMSKIN
jgi:hypothetical protein